MAHVPRGLGMNTFGTNVNRGAQRGRGLNVKRSKEYSTVPTESMMYYVIL